MSATHKPSLHLGSDGSIVVGRVRKDTRNPVIEGATDVTDTFVGIMLHKFGPEAPSTVEQTEIKIPGATYRITVERMEA